MLADDSLDGRVFEKAVGRLEEPELLEMKRSFEERVAKRFPAAPQLKNRCAADEDTDAFLI